VTVNPTHDQPLRGQVYDVDLPGIGRKPLLIVSNNQRNQRLGDVLVVRITTAPRPPLPTIIELAPGDRPLVGRILCDDIFVLPKDRLAGRTKGALTPSTMRRVEHGLAQALGNTTLR